jgi:hypothetical protein
VIIDRGSLAAGGRHLSSAEEAARRAQDQRAGHRGEILHLDYARWIAPAAAEAHKLGLHVGGHIPQARPIEVRRWL